MITFFISLCRSKLYHYPFDEIWNKKVNFFTKYVFLGSMNTTKKSFKLYIERKGVNKNV